MSQERNLEILGLGHLIRQPQALYEALQALLARLESADSSLQHDPLERVVMIAKCKLELQRLVAMH
jgi:hypothetical protein